MNAMVVFTICLPYLDTPMRRQALVLHAASAQAQTAVAGAIPIVIEMSVSGLRASWPYYTGQWGFTLEEQEVEEHPGEFSLVPRLDANVRAKKRGPSPKQKSLLSEVIAQAIDEAWVSIMPFADAPAIKAVPDRIVRDFSA
jgi:hypothetical protein